MEQNFIFLAGFEIYFSYFEALRFSFGGNSTFVEAADSSGLNKTFDTKSVISRQKVVVRDRTFRFPPPKLSDSDSVLVASGDFVLDALPFSLQTVGGDLAG